MPKFHDIGPAARRVLDYFAKYAQENGKSPTLQEASVELKLSRPTICGHLDRLQMGGYIARKPFVQRNVVVLKTSIPEPSSSAA